eukprot:44468-Rhodomonas_salina.2
MSYSLLLSFCTSIACPIAQPMSVKARFVSLALLTFLGRSTAASGADARSAALEEDGYLALICRRLALCALWVTN